ncbi:hypothetical protein AAGS61_11650 [Lysinibacillus sp. KU-BSD001]|uniref:hypothetical protein n=1 Tax=Lysinibacillus sp. KU-BSD001 TaxID=3141328 RepID=UPI0036ED33B4
MDISLIVMGVGIIFIILSFFFKDSSKQLEKDLEELSISIYQETNSMKRRLKIVEEELLLEPSFKVQSPKTQAKKDPMATFQQVAAQVKATQTVQQPMQRATTQPVHSILVSQVIELNKQGLSIEEISKRSTLTPEQIQGILANGGV